MLQLTTAQNLGTTEDQYLRVIRGKTAALFSAATESGAVLAGASEDKVRALFTYGDALGISFSDGRLIFWISAVRATGSAKRIGDDFRERKVTLPVIRAVARADDTERAFWQRTIAKGDQQDGDFEQACAIIARHGTLEETRAEAIEWSERAKEALIVLPETPLRAMLSDLATYVVQRLK